MKKTTSHFSSIALAAIFIVALGLSPQASAVKGSDYYKEGYSPMLNPYPKDTGRGSGTWTIRYFGPVGIGIDLKRPGMTMEINNVEEGSPADKTGKLEKGQIIESINGEVLEDFDPRILLGNIITEAEATDGIIDLKIKGQGNVRVKIPVMGAYSDTWPVNCPKTDKIVRNLADLIAQEDKPSWGSIIFLLSTGEEKDLDVVRGWMRNMDNISGMTWGLGYVGIGVCEYYLRTGDESVLPLIKKGTEDLKERMYQGGWSGRNMPARFTYSTGTGQVHASGMNAMTFLLMARLCGVDVDERMLQESFKQFYRFAGHGNVPYGNGPPEGGFRDNGKHSGLAVALEAATQLTPEGESSVYANARDTAAMKSFYATNWFHAAHTGGGMGEIWHHGAMAMMREKRPVPYRSYMDTRRWVMDLSRRHDGSIAIEGMDDRYNRSVTDSRGGRAWGTYFALTYTYPRKQLQLWGAARSPHADTYKLPKRPWGNAMDDIFQSPKPIYVGEKIKYSREELMNEKVPTDSSLPVLDKLNDPNVSEKEVFKYMLHPEYGLRVVAARSAVNRGFSQLVVPLLESGDPRLREVGLLTLAGMFKGRAFPDDKLTPEMFDLVGQIVDDPNEAWWVALHAIKALGRADPDRIGEHRDRLLEFLDYDSDFIQKSAVITLTKIATEREHYQAVLPPIIAKSASFLIDSSSRTTADAIRNAIKNANSKVKSFAEPYLKEAYASVPAQVQDPYTGASPRDAGKVIRSRIGSILQQLPEGEEFVRRIPKETVESYKSGRDADMYQYSGKFERNDELVDTWVWAVWPNPDHPDEIDEKIENWLKGKDRPIKLEKPKDTLQLKNGGEVAKSRYFSDYFWSGNMLIGINSGVAQKMHLKTHDGVDFLVIEKGGFGGGDPDDEGTEAVPDDWHPGYSVYIRKN
ncbi:MAG: DUF6288 domain-containing protein [Opitutales bacterium]